MNATLTTADKGRLRRATVGSIRQAAKFAAEDLTSGADVVRLQADNPEDVAAMEAALRRASGGARASVTGWFLIEGRKALTAIDFRSPAVPLLKRLVGIRPEADAEQVGLFAEECGRREGTTSALRAGL